MRNGGKQRERRWGRPKLRCRKGWQGGEGEECFVGWSVAVQNHNGARLAIPRLALPLSCLLPVPLPLGTLCDVINAFLLLFQPLHEPAELPTECDKTTRVRYWLPLVTWSSLPSSNFQLNYNRKGYVDCTTIATTYPPYARTERAD